MKTKRLFAILTALVVLASVLTVCFSVYAEQVEEQIEEQIEEQVEEPAYEPKTIQVVLKEDTSDGNYFQLPANTTVNVGDKITWPKEQPNYITEEGKSISFINIGTSWDAGCWGQPWGSVNANYAHTVVEGENKITLFEGWDAEAGASVQVGKVIFKFNSGDKGPEEEVKGESIKGSKWESIPLKKADWLGTEDAMSKFDMNGHFAVDDQTPRQVWSVKGYNLEELEGFTLTGFVKMDNGYNNYYGEHCSLIIGNGSLDEEGNPVYTDNLELRVVNDVDEEGKGLVTYSVQILQNGEVIGNYAIGAVATGTYTMIVKGDKVSATYEGEAITFDEGKELTIGKIEKLGNKQISLYCTGNWNPSNRYWTDVVLADIAVASEEGGNGEGGNGSGNGSSVKTADTRNIVVPVCVALASVCAAAFVVMGKKARA